MRAFLTFPASSILTIRTFPALYDEFTAHHIFIEYFIFIFTFAHSRLPANFLIQCRITLCTECAILASHLTRLTFCTNILLIHVDYTSLCLHVSRIADALPSGDIRLLIVEWTVEALKWCRIKPFIACAFYEVWIYWLGVSEITR